MKATEVLKELEQSDGFLLTDKDRAFAQEISAEFTVPFEEVCIEVGLTHGVIQCDIEQYNNLRGWNITEYQALKDSLEDIEAIHILTSKGPVKFSKEDSYFPLFERAIKKVRASCDKIIHSENNPLPQSQLDKILRLEPLTAFLPSASTWNRLVIIGRLLVYFKVDPSFTTKEEYTEHQLTSKRPYAYQDYNHFLADRVKRRLLKLQ